MSYHPKQKLSKTTNNSISALRNNLFGKINQIEESNHYKKYQADPLFNEFEEDTPSEESVLAKAKKITYSNKTKIQRMRNQIKKLESAQTGDFMTGVGIYTEQNQKEQQPYLPQIDENQLFNSLAGTKHDDLEQLRKMIKKTEGRLKNYSRSVFHIQSEVQNAADKCGQELDIGLAIKINRCNLRNTFFKAPKNKTIEEVQGRRTFSSYNNKRNKN